MKFQKTSIDFYVTIIILILPHCIGFSIIENTYSSLDALRSIFPRKNISLMIERLGHRHIYFLATIYPGKAFS